MTALDDRIAALHVRMVRAEDACHEAEAEYWRVEISDLEHERDSQAFSSLTKSDEPAP